MRHFSFRPTMSPTGRQFKGLRGFAGKPFHPPLTDIPVTAYLFAAVFDVLSIALKGSHQVVARQLFVVGHLGGARRRAGCRCWRRSPAGRTGAG